MAGPPLARVFPADDPISPFAMAMAIAGNDVEHAVRQAVRTNTENRPEFGYWVRVSSGFLFEGVRLRRPSHSFGSSW